MVVGSLLAVYNRHTDTMIPATAKRWSTPLQFPFIWKYFGDIEKLLSSI